MWQLQRRTEQQRAEQRRVTVSRQARYDEEYVLAKQRQRGGAGTPLLLTRADRNNSRVDLDLDHNPQKTWGYVDVSGRQVVRPRTVEYAQEHSGRPF